MKNTKKTIEKNEQKLIQNLLNKSHVDLKSTLKTCKNLNDVKTSITKALNDLKQKYNSNTNDKQLSYFELDLVIVSPSYVNLHNAQEFFKIISKHCVAIENSAFLNHKLFLLIVKSLQNAYEIETDKNTGLVQNYCETIFNKLGKFVPIKLV